MNIVFLVESKTGAKQVCSLTEHEKNSDPRLKTLGIELAKMLCGEIDSGTEKIIEITKALNMKFTVKQDFSTRYTVYLAQNAKAVISFDSNKTEITITRMKPEDYITLFTFSDQS